MVACEVVILILCKGIRLILRSEIFNIKKSFHLVLGVGFLLEIVCVFVVGVYFVACTLCVICLLYKGRSGADQCDQDTRPTSRVGKNKGKTRTQIVKSVKIRSYALKTSPIASTKPPESSPTSATTESNYHQ